MHRMGAQVHALGANEPICTPLATPLRAMPLVSVTELTATYLVCESKIRCQKVPYGVPNAWFVWISPKTLCSPVLASFADSKLLDFSRASDSMTWRVNRTLCVARYIRYVRTTLGACAIGTVVNAASLRSGHAPWRTFDDHGMTVASFQP